METCNLMLKKPFISKAQVVSFGQNWTFWPNTVATEGAYTIMVLSGLQRFMTPKGI